MAGTQIREYLNPSNYDHFYELFHALSEVVLSKISVIRTACHILNTLHAQTPQVFSNVDAATHLTAFNKFTVEFDADMRRFFWPQQGKDSTQVTSLSMARWTPYHETAWDDMFTQMVAVLQPAVNSAFDHYKQTNSLSLGDSPYSENIKSLLVQMEAQINDLSRLCYPQEVERFLFRPPRI